MMRGPARSFSLWLFVSLGMAAPEAWAYLDPSTGSMILTALVGMLATATLAVKTFWYRIKALFRPRPSQAAKREDPPLSGADSPRPAHTTAAGERKPVSD